MPTVATEISGQDRTEPLNVKRRAGRTRLWLVLGSAVAVLGLLLVWAVGDAGLSPSTPGPTTTVHAPSTVPKTTSPPATASPQTNPSRPVGHRHDQGQGQGKHHGQNRGAGHDQGNGQGQGNGHDHGQGQGD